MMHNDISSASLYKIGTGWLFDVESKLGYKVNRVGGSRKEPIKDFVEAFQVVEGSNTSDIRYITKVPMGVVRKALHLLELKSKGELKDRDARQ
jgi:hypothetical protein